MIATLTPPRLQLEEEPEIEEETELVGARARRRRGRGGRARAPARATPAASSARRCACRVAGGAPVDWLIVGLGNPGRRVRGHAPQHRLRDRRTCSRERWELPKAKSKYRGLLTEGRTGPGGPRVAILLPQTYMNDAGESVGPARGALKVPLDHVLVLHDEIDLPFGEIRVRIGGGLAGHNGLKSLKAALGSAGLRARAGRRGAARRRPIRTASRRTCSAASGSRARRSRADRAGRGRGRAGRCCGDRSCRRYLDSQ